MSHFSPEILERAVATANEPELLTVDQVRDTMRAELDGTAAAKARLARRLRISEAQLSYTLRSKRGLGDELAAALGFRKVVRFERVR